MPSLPLQPTAPMTPAEVALCVDAILHASTMDRPDYTPSLPSTTPLLLTYMSSLPASWPLGITAALRGVPLAVHGLGMAWGGPGVRVPAVRRAAQVVAQLRGLSTVLAAADGADVIVANPPPGRLASEAARSPRMLVGGECNAWPNCDRDAYARDAMHQQCLRSGRAACFANAGAYMASARTLLALLPVWERLRTPETVNWRHLRFNDQAALHTLYLQQAAELNGTTSVAVDSANEMHLSLSACRKPVYSNNKARRIRQEAQCMTREHEPLQALEISTSPDTGIVVARTPWARTPWLLHAPGNHSSLQHIADAALQSASRHGLKWRKAHEAIVLLVDASPAVAGHPSGCGARPLKELLGLQQNTASPRTASGLRVVRHVASIHRDRGPGRASAKGAGAPPRPLVGRQHGRPPHSG